MRQLARLADELSAGELTAGELTAGELTGRKNGGKLLRRQRFTRRGISHTTNHICYKGTNTSHHSSIYFTRAYIQYMVYIDQRRYTNKNY